MSDHVAIGYKAVRPADGSPFDARYVPRRVVSASDCIAEVGPWSWWMGDAHERFTGFGIPADRFDAYVAWAKESEAAGRLEMNISRDLEVVRSFVADFCEDLDVVICGLAVSADLAGRLGYIEPGLLAVGGTVLGYEILCFEDQVGSHHSWTCNALQHDALTASGTAVSADGFIDRLDDAKAVADFINLPETGAEPGLWAPVLLVEYEA